MWDPELVGEFGAAVGKEHRMKVAEGEYVIK
jgi:hypothetical protein